MRVAPPLAFWRRLYSLWPNRRRQAGGGITLALVFAPCVFAHSGEPLAPHDLWTAWGFEPGILIPLALSGWLYLRCARNPAHGLRRWEIGAFALGWLTLFIALVSPLHPLGEALFSAHMVQHELIMTVAAPLLVLGRPTVAFLWAMPMNWRRALGAAAKARTWRALTSPLSAWWGSAIVLWVWHAPALFQATLTSDLVHTLQHLSFLISSLLFWWTVIRGRSSSVFYLFTTAIQTSILGALLTFSPLVWYPAYAPTTAAWGLTPLEDQQLAGLIMWVPPSVVYIGAGLALFALWLRQSEARRVIASSAVIVLALIGCSDRRSVEKAAAVVSGGGNPRRGRDVIQYYGCPACHTINGVPNAHGLVGPPLTGVASRVYIAGMLPNTADNLMHWVENPKKINERTAMPNMNVTAADARDIAGYLYTLK